EPADAQRLADEIAFFAPGLRSAVFPDWETLPYDTFSPHEDLISERLATLWRIQRGDVDVVLMPATTALVRLAPPSFIAGYTFHFATRQRLDEAALKAQLTLAGYTHVSQVVSPGEYAVRGGLIDLFPMGSAVPYRVDLLHGEIDEALQRFWADTRERHRFFQHDRERPVLAPEALFLKPEDFFTACGEHAQLSVRGAGAAHDAAWASTLPDLGVDRGAPEPL